MKKIVFSDIDGILIHKRNDNGDDQVTIPGEQYSIGKKVIQMINKIRSANHLFILITGRRESNYKKVAEIIPHDYAIIEHGSLILKGGKIEKTWLAPLKESIGEITKKDGPLWEYEKKLIKDGYKTDSEGRIASFRVFYDKPTNLTPQEKEDLLIKVREEGEDYKVKVVENEDMLDIIPVMGGKASAIEHLLSTLNIEFDSVVTIGHEKNDLSMMEMELETVHELACPSNSKNDIKNVVKKKGGYISTSEGDEGSLDILQHIFPDLLEE